MFLARSVSLAILSDSGSFPDPKIISSCCGSDLSAKESQKNTATHPLKRSNTASDDFFNRNYCRDISCYRRLGGRSTAENPPMERARKGNKDEPKETDNELQRKDDGVFCFHNQSSDHGLAKRNEQRDLVADEFCEGSGNLSAAAGGRSVGHVGTCAPGALGGGHCGGGCSEARAQQPASRILLFGCDIDGNDGDGGIDGGERPPPQFIIRLFGVEFYVS